MEQTKQELLSNVIDLIVESLNLYFINKSDVTEHTTLMNDGLGLDSVDILEVVVAVEQQYGVKILNAEQGKQIFQSVGTICDFILASQSGARRDNSIKEQTV